MSVSFSTEDPEALLKNFNAAIEQEKQKGKITTWERSSDKKYYTHKAPEWRRKAWFKPSIHAELLLFNIIKPKNAKVSAITYGYYHGHLIETFLNHFDESFSNGSASALPTANDKIS